MKIFKGFNQDGEPCPICNTTEDKPCTLIPIDGTASGNICQAKAVHLDCIKLRFSQEAGILYQKLD
jgi:hypothetical protein